MVLFNNKKKNNKLKMDYKPNRLRFAHCDILFENSEKAKAYVNGDLIFQKRPSLYAEPMVLKYGDEKNPNILLAIGSVGDGVTSTLDNKVVFIDCGKINIENYIFNDSSSISLEKDTNEQGFSVTAKVQIPSNTIIDNVLLTNNIIETENGVFSHNSIKLEENNLVVNTNGNVQKFLVNDAIALSKEPNNIIERKNDGFYADNSNVSLTFNKSTNTLIFTNGIHKETITLTEHTLVTDGYYENGAIVLVIKTANEYGELSDTILRIPVTELVEVLTVNNEKEIGNPIKLIIDTDNSTGKQTIYGHVQLFEGGVLKNKDGVLYVSDDVSDYKVEYGENGEVMPLKTVLNIISDNNNSLQEFVELDKKVNALEVQITQLQNVINNLIDFGMDASKVMTEQIQIIGTPLADLILKSNPSLTAFTESNVQDILETLLSQELWPNEENIKYITGSTSASITVPTVYINETLRSTNGNLSLEVGTEINISASIEESICQKNPSQVQGLTYGYSKVNDNIKDSTATTYTSEISVTRNETESYSMVCNITGFTENGFTDITKTNYNDVKIDNYNLGNVKDNDNKISIKVTGQTFNYTIDKLSQIYPCSNLGKTKESLITKSIDAIEGKTNVPTNTFNFTITGIRYGFYGSAENDFEINSNNLRTLNKFTKNNNEIAITSDIAYQTIVAIPVQWNKKITNVTAINEQNAVITNTYVLQKTISVNGANNLSPIDYNVYIYKPNNPVEKLNHIITLDSN